MEKCANPFPRGGLCFKAHLLQDMTTTYSSAQSPLCTASDGARMQGGGQTALLGPWPLPGPQRSR